MMPTLMIHEMSTGMKIPKDPLLTFDDGLYTQYLHGKHLPNRKIFFISSSIICDSYQSDAFITAPEAHKKAFLGNMENYMTLDQIKELRDLGNEIGGHSHFHHRLSKFPTLFEKTNHIKMDTELMLDWFLANLGIIPTSFCFPYNEDFHGFYMAILKQYGFVNFYGNERTNIAEISV